MPPPRPVPPEWKAIVSDARQNNRLVYSMDQTNLIRLAGVDDAELTEDGVCLAVSIRWLGLRLTGNDFTGFAEGASFRHIVRIPPITYTEQLDSFFDKELGRTEKAVVRQLMLAKQGLRILGKHAGPGSLAGAPPYLGGGLAVGLYQISLVARGGLHAIALEIEADALRLFDANFGHFRITGDAQAVQNYLRFYFQTSGYQDRYTAGYILFRLGPNGASPLNPQDQALPLPASHYLLDRSYLSLPSSKPAAVVEGGSDLPFHVRLRRAINRVYGSGLRVFVVGRNDNAWRACVHAALADCDMFVRSKHYHLRVTPFILDTVQQTEVRLHYY